MNNHSNRGKTSFFIAIFQCFPRHRSFVVVHELHKKGMIVLHQSKNDQRAINVTLTQKCYDHFSSRENAGNMLLDKLFSGTSLIETEQTAMLLGKMLRNSEICIDEDRSKFPG